MAETTSDAEPRTGARRVPSVGVSLALVAAGGCAGTLVRAALERAWLTTHSTFILESHRLLASGGATDHAALGAAYLVGSMAVGLTAAGLGLWLAGRLHRRETS